MVHARPYGARHDGAVDGDRRADLVRMAVSADDLHGDAVPEARVPDRRIGRTAAAPGSRPWTARAGAAKGVKHGVFFVLSFVIANVFLAWIIGAAGAAIESYRPAERTSRRLRGDLLFSLRVLHACSRGSGSRPACWPAPTAACCRRSSIGRPSRSPTTRRAASRGDANRHAGDGSSTRRLHRLPSLRHRVPDRHRHPQRHSARVRRVHGVHRCVQRRHDSGSAAHRV